MFVEVSEKKEKVDFLRDSKEDEVMKVITDLEDISLDLQV